MARAYGCVHNAGEEMKLFVASTTNIGFGEPGSFSHVIRFDKNRKYLFGIDQSYSTPGVCVCTDNFDFVVILTIISDDVSHRKRDSLLTTMEDLTTRILLGLDLRFISWENVPPSKRSYTVKDLSELRGIVKSWFEKIPTTRGMDRDYWFCPQPNQWKSQVYDAKATKAAKKSGSNSRDGAFRSKQQIALDICKLFPHLKPYYDLLYRNRGEHDFDGFDAFGIVFGTRVMFLTPEWELRNKQSKYQYGHFVVVYKYLSDQQIIGGELTQGLEAYAQLDKLDYREWNMSESIFENFVMSANTDKVIVMELLSNKHILAVMTEFDIPFDESKKMYCIVSKMGSSKITFTEGILKGISTGGFVRHFY